MQQDMKYIYQVYIDGSFSKAAENLHLTQPALSIAIQKAESSIGMPLFDRTTRPLQLTAVGKIYIDAIKKMEYLEQELKHQISDIQNLNSGEIRLGGSHYLNAYVLPKVLSKFSQEYPGIRLTLVEEGSNVLAEMLTERKLDLTFSCNPSFIGDFERYPLFHDHILLAVPKSNRVNQKAASYALTASDIICGRHLRPDCDFISLEEFRELEYILLTPGNNLYDRAVKLFENAGFEPKIKLQLAQLATAYHLAAENFAATFVSDRMIRQPDVSLVFYKIDPVFSDRLFYILLPDTIYTSHAVKKLIQYLLLHFQEPED